MATPLVLVIDDDRRYRDLIELNLTRRGYRVLLAGDGLTGLNMFERDGPDLVILDLMLPELDGYDVCRRLREYSNVAIIILTAHAGEIQKIQGLELGADDYITKPFGAGELLARIGAVLRRTQAQSEVVSPPTLILGNLTLDFHRRRITLGDQPVHLTPYEYRLLYQLALAPGRVLTQDELLQRVWGTGYQGESQLLHTTVLRLRRKIELDCATPRHVVTCRGIGYMLASEATLVPNS